MSDTDASPPTEKKKRKKKKDKDGKSKKKKKRKVETEEAAAEVTVDDRPKKKDKKKGKKKKKKELPNNGEVKHAKNAEASDKMEGKKPKKRKKDSFYGGRRTIFIEAIAQRADIDVDEAMALFEGLHRTLRRMPVGARVVMPKIGSFVKKKMKARLIMNLQTKEREIMPGRNKVVFKPTDRMRKLNVGEDDE